MINFSEQEVRLKQEAECLQREIDALNNKKKQIDKEINSMKPTFLAVSN